MLAAQATVQQRYRHHYISADSGEFPRGTALLLWFNYTRVVTLMRFEQAQLVYCYRV
jgi:hypothetical protein